ncbi:hypothetical protein H8356DRAFT_1431478 [Neocallimastix lanati (nom. inval.)]|nr:hypothetical protein H8356DRAFT_1431478 [Neocallimastix sp. JGI-2020a]
MKRENNKGLQQKYKRLFLYAALYNGGTNYINPFIDQVPFCTSKLYIITPYLLIGLDVMIIRFINRNSINPNLKINMMIFDVIIKIIFDTILNTYKIGARKFSNIEYTTTRYMAPLNSSDGQSKWSANKTDDPKNYFLV